MATQRETARCRSTTVDAEPADGPDTDRIPAQRQASPTAVEQSSASPSPSATTPPPGTGRRLWQRKGARRAALASAALVQALIIVGATSWISTRSDAAEPRGATTPITWVGIVHGTGDSELNLRRTPEVAEENTARAAVSGDQLQILCGQTGDSVSGEPGRTGVWLKTTDALYVSQLYVTVPGQTHVPRCPEPDVLLIEMPVQPIQPIPSAQTPVDTTRAQADCGASRCGRSSEATPATREPRRSTSAEEAAPRSAEGESTAPQQPVALGGVSGAPSTTRPAPSSDGNLGTASRVETDHDKTAPTKKRKKSKVG